MYRAMHTIADSNRMRLTGIIHIPTESSLGLATVTSYLVEVVILIPEAVKLIMPSYKLVYFDSRGRAELSRLLFHAAGVPFDDIRLTHEEFQARKSSFSFEEVPVLEVDGVMYSQSLGIATYLAKEFGYFGKTNLDSLKINEVLLHIMDIFNILTTFYYEKDEVKKEQFKKEAVEKKLPKAVGYLAKLLQKSGTGYFVGSEMTLADIAVFDVCTLMEDIKFLKTSSSPDEIQKLVEKVSKHPKLVKYISERK